MLKPVKGHVFPQFAEQGPTNEKKADAERKTISLLIQENIIPTRRNPKFLFQTVFLGIVQGLLMIPKPPPTYAFHVLWN